MPPPRMTANPVRPSRYRPGQPLPEAQTSSEDESDDGSDGASETQNQLASSAPQTKQAPPKATSFKATSAAKVAANLKNVDLNERKKRAEAEEKERVKYEREEQERREREAGFVTESESGSEESDEDSEEEEDEVEEALVQGGDYAAAARPQPAQRPPKPKPPQSQQSSASSDSESGSEESDTSESSSEEDTKPKLARPIFIKKSDRKPTETISAEEQEAQEAARRQQAADDLVQTRIDLDAAARAAGKKSWDDDAPDEGEYPDDTDGLDPELEHAQWVARELTRLKRARAQLEEREKEIEEIERRRNLSAAEREREDREFVEAQKEEKAGRGKANILQKYHHSGAFFQDDAEAAELKNRNLMGAAYEDQSTLAKEMFKVRDVTKIGRKGQTRHRDLKSDDTGRWGDFLKDGRKGDFNGVDERFRPDRGAHGGTGATGANAGPVGEKRGTYSRDSDQRDLEAKRRRLS